MNPFRHPLLVTRLLPALLAVAAGLLIVRSARRPVRPAGEAPPPALPRGGPLPESAKSLPTGRTFRPAESASASFEASTGGSERRLVVRAVGDRVSLYASEVPLGDVLLALADSVGAQAWIDPSLIDRPIRVEIRDASLEDVLDAVASPLSYSILWSREARGVPAGDRPERIVLYRSGRKDAVERLTRAVSTGNVSDGGMGSPGAGAVEDELVLRLSAAAPRSVLDRFLSRHGATVTGEIPSLRSYRLRFPPGTDLDAVRAEIEASPDVETVENNFYAEPVRDVLLPSQPGLDEIRRRLLSLPRGAPSGGSDPVAALLDSGVDPAYPALEGVVLPGYDMIDDVAGGRIDDMGHGTAMAHVLSGYYLDTAGDPPPAREGAVSILPVRIFASGEKGTYFDAVEGIVYAVDAGAAVINMSWAGERPSALLDDAIAYAVEHGTVLVAAVGNEGVDEPRYPAAHPDVIGVGAVDADGSRFDFSNSGSQVEFVAAGEAAFPDREPGRLLLVRGTSVASAVVANTAIRILREHPDWTPEHVRRRLGELAGDAGPPGTDPYYGRGIVPPSPEGTPKPR